MTSTKLFKYSLVDAVQAGLHFKLID